MNRVVDRIRRHQVTAFFTPGILMMFRLLIPAIYLIMRGSLVGQTLTK